MSVQGNIVIGHGIEVRSAMAEARTRDASKRKPVRQRDDLAADPCIAKLPVSTHRWILSFVGPIDTPFRWTPNQLHHRRHFRSLPELNCIHYNVDL